MISEQEYYLMINNYAVLLCHNWLSTEEYNISKLELHYKDVQDISFHDFYWHNFISENLMYFSNNKFDDFSKEFLQGCRAYSKYLEYAINNVCDWQYTNFISTIKEVIKREILIETIKKYSNILIEKFPERTTNMIKEMNSYFSDFDYICENYFQYLL